MSSNPSPKSTIPLEGTFDRRQTPPQNPPFPLFFASLKTPTPIMIPSLSQFGDFVTVASYGFRPWGGEFHNLETDVVLPQSDPGTDGSSVHKVGKVVFPQPPAAGTTSTEHSSPAEYLRTIVFRSLTRSSNAITEPFNNYN
ncbi:hypothetical protein L2E82_40659 [Cichorium intybus]|uniref:Uncharacterized protein n=1 Tax=Cichorium intybus TaxID=13427 RepID=A0ACB9AKV9_CICIN|nr:hypothetical protein L2E82_40659 [Cichorium intybus]